MSKQYLPSPSVEVDEDEFALFCELTEERADAEVTLVERDFFETIESWPALQQYRYWRRYVLINIMTNRRRLRDPKLARIDVIDQLWRDGIKKSQLSLLKHRHHLRTGAWPGTA